MVGDGHSQLVSVVFSFRNEEDVLDELIRRLDAVFDALDCEREYIFVNDDSSDGSLAILTGKNQQDNRVKVINMSRRFGVNPCFLAGMRYAKGDAVITMDTDLQDPPEVIPRLIEAWRGGAEVVYTTRTQRLGESGVKLGLTALGYRLIARLSDVDLPEEAGMFRLIGRRALDQLLAVGEQDSYLRGLMSWVGFKQTEVQYERDPRFAGEAHFSIFGTAPIKELIRAVTSFSVLPLTAVLVLGAGLTAASALALAVMGVLWAAGTGVGGIAVLVACMGLMGGVQLTGFGLVALYVARIHNQVRQRPAYIVADTIGVEDAS